MSAERAPAGEMAAEMAVVSAALLINGFWEHAMRLPKPDDFDDADLAAIWEATLEARAAGAVTRLTVGRHLRELGWDDKRAFAAVKAAEARFCTLAEALAAIEILLERRVQRRAQAELRKTLKELETTTDVLEVIHRHERQIADIAGQADGADSFVRGDKINEEHLERVETGLEDVDRVSGGLASGVVTYIAARPSMGKTALAVTLLRNIAGRGLGAACYSLEDPALSLIHRAASAHAYKPCRPVESRKENPWYSDYEARILQGEMRERYESALAHVRRLPIYWDEKAGRTASQIRLGGRRVRLTAQREGFDLRVLMVDHLGKVRPDRDRDNGHRELKEVSNTLQETAKEIRIPVVAMVQLNREVEKRPDKRPLLSDMRESGSLEEDAHTVWALYRQAYYDDRARDRGEEIDEDKAAKARFVMEIAFLKNKGGPLRVIPVFCDLGANVILDRKVGFSQVPGHSRDMEDLFA